MSKLLNVNEVAAMLGISRATVYNLINQKGLPFVKVGRSTRFNVDEVNAWIKKQNQ